MSVVRLNTGSDVDNILEMADLCKAGDITHGVAIYRKKDGILCYRLFADSVDHITYIIGMLERIKMWIYEEAIKDE